MRFNQIVLASLIVCLFQLGIKTYGEERVSYWNQPIKINPSDRPLVTGIDLDAVMSRYIEDYEAFERRPMIGPNGMVWRWSVKPDPDDPETRYFWGAKRKTAYYKRMIVTTVGVFPSHEEAVKRAVDYMKSISIIIPCINNGLSEPGLVEWEGGRTVRDNVFYGVTFCTEPFDREAIQQQLARDILEGAEGITKGAYAELPQIDGTEIPDEVTIPLGESIRLPLYASDPNSRGFRRNALFRQDNSKNVLPPELQPRSPSLDWITPDSLEVREHGSISGTLTAVVINDRCVISDVFEKKISIKVPDTVR